MGVDQRDADSDSPGNVNRRDLASNTELEATPAKHKPDPKYAVGATMVVLLSWRDGVESLCDRFSGRGNRIEDETGYVP